MSSHNTNNSLQSAFYATTSWATHLLLASSTSASNVCTPSPLCESVPGTTAGGTTISLELVALIAKTVQKAVAAERSQHSGLAGSQSMQASSCSSNNKSSGGVPESLHASAMNFLASGSGILGPHTTHTPQGRPISSVCVPSFVSTFAAPVMSLAPFASSALSLSSRAIIASKYIDLSDL